MADKRDYYEVLGVQKNASDDENKKKRLDKRQKSITRIFIRVIKNVKHALKR